MEMVLAILVAGGVVAIALLVNARMEKKKRVTKHFSIELPTGWRQEPGENAFTFAREGDNGGTLQVSLHPPYKSNPTTPKEAEERLTESVQRFSINIGEQISIVSEQTEQGIVARARYKGDQGLIQLWMLPLDLTVFATYIPGGSEDVEEEFKEADNIVKTISFR